MSKLVKFIMGGAGMGKSEFCRSIQEYSEKQSIYINVINLDSATEPSYKCCYDIRDLIEVSDIKDDLNSIGGCYQQQEHLNWLNACELNELIDVINDSEECTCFIVDCPGNIFDLASLQAIRNIANNLSWKCNAQVNIVVLIEYSNLTLPQNYLSFMKVNNFIEGLTPNIHKEIIITKLDTLTSSQMERLQILLQLDEDKYFRKLISQLDISQCQFIQRYNIDLNIPLKRILQYNRASKNSKDKIYRELTHFNE